MLVAGSDLLYNFELILSNIIGAGNNNSTTTNLQFEDVCGDAIDAEELAHAANVLASKLCNASDAVASVRDLFSCRTWYPLYEEIVYDTFCYNVDGFAYIAFTQFFVVCLAFIIITCRVTIYQGIEIGESYILDSEVAATKEDGIIDSHDEREKHESSDETVPVAAPPDIIVDSNDELKKHEPDDIKVPSGTITTDSTKNDENKKNCRMSR